MRSVGGPKRHEHSQHRHNPMRHKRKPPRGMHLHSDDLKAMVTGPVGKAEAILKTLDSELVTAKRAVSCSACQIYLLKRLLIGNVQVVLITEVNVLSFTDKRES